MKKYTIAIVVLALIGTLSIASASQGGNPFQKL